MESMIRSTHRKKLPKTSSTVTSFSGGYNGVFSVPAAQRFKPPGGVGDYGEIFGGGGRGSSIPVLDLSVVDETTENFRSSKVDYGTIFGGFEDDDLAVSYEELEVRGCGDNKWSNGNSKARNHSEKEFPPQGEASCNMSENSKQPPSEAPITSIDGMKQLNMSYLTTSQENIKQPNGMTHVAKLHAVPGFTYFVNEPPTKKKTESGMPITPIKGEVHRTWSFSGNVPAENNRNTEMLLPGKPTAEGLSRAKSGSWQVGSQSKDGSFNRSERDLKSQSFDTSPSSDKFLESCGIRSNPKPLKSSNISSKVNPFEKSTSNGTDGSSDEELDINSDAAACAAALKRVLEKAQESIRLAKEIRERGGKEGIQRFSNLSSEHSFKAKDKKNGFDQENNSKKQNVKDRNKRLGRELDESNERNSRFGSRNAGVSTASECGQEPLTSIEAADEKSQLNYAEVDGKSKQFLELVDTGINIASTLAFHQVEMDKSTALLSMKKQETEASLSMEKQENIVCETTTKETTEQIENNVKIEKSLEKDFGMGIAENNVHLGEQTKVSVVTANASDSAPIKNEFRTTVGLEITENGAQSEDIKSILDKLRHCEIKLSECLDMGEEKKTEASKTEDQHMSNDWQNMAKVEVPREDSQQVQAKLQYFYSHSQEEKENGLYSCNEGGKVHQEGCGIVTSDDVTEVCGSGSPERAHKDSLEGETCGTSNGLDSCHEGGIVQQDVCGFVASDDAPEICGSGSQKRTLKDSQEGEASAASNGLDSCNELGIVQPEACGFVASDDASEICGSGSGGRTHEDSQEGESCGVSNGLDNHNEKGMVKQVACSFVASVDAPEVCDSGNCGRTHKDSQEGEACGTSDVNQDIGVNDSDLIAEQKGEEYPTVPYEELNKKVVVAPNDKKLVRVPHEEKSSKVLKEEHLEGEDQKISEEPYKHVKVDWSAFGGEYDWREVEKRIKKGCTIEDNELIWSEKYEIPASNAVKLIQETEETTGVREENDNFDNIEQIDLQQRVAYEKNFDPDAYESLHDVHEAHSAGVVEDHEASKSTTSTSEDFDDCEWEGNSEEVLKACDFTKLDEKSDIVLEDRVSSSGTEGSFMAVESDENGTNPDEIGVSCEHNLPQENVLETTYFIQEAEEDIDVRLKQQDVSEDQKSTNFAFPADREETITEKNVKEPEPSINFKSGGDFFYRFRENAEHANEEFPFDKEDDYVDPKVVHRVENKEKEIDETKSSDVAHQATDTKESVKEMITGQNIQFVRSKPRKNDLPEDNEARESSQKDLKDKEHSTRIEEMKRERARDKDRIAVERAIREARERAFAEAREKAERAAVARAGAEVRQRMMAEAREKLEKASAETKLADKASIEAKQRAERAAVERATAEARERALEKALSQKTTSQGRVQTDRLHGTPKDSALKHSLSSSDLERDGNNSESAQRRKARLERHERIMERAAQALAEKNMRDLQAQKEQAERNRLAESLDADVKRWANGKEKNLRALLSTLQYILGPDSGWQPISLTETITRAAVKKAYRKATLYVHPDKLQQRGASIQQKYICEKVFDLLKAAWNKFNSEER